MKFPAFLRSIAGRLSLMTAALVLLPAVLSAQAPADSAAAAAPVPAIATPDVLEFLGFKWIMGALAVILLLVIYILIELRVKDPSKFSIAYLLKSVTGKDAEDELLDHNYDGIRELDNPMPAWLKLVLWGSVIWGGMYLMYYHVLHLGPLMAAEYDNEVKEATELYANMELPESELKEDQSPVTLEAGKTAFLTTYNCGSCHGVLGEGGTGPNLTDKYWIHGGTVKDIFKSVTEGYPEKGMARWKDLIPSMERLKITNYILSLQGTNPPGAKGPEGVLAGSSAPAPAPDSLAADTLQTATPAADTAAKGPAK